MTTNQKRRISINWPVSIALSVAVTVLFAVLHVPALLVVIPAMIWLWRLNDTQKSRLAGRCHDAMHRLVDSLSDDTDNNQMH